MARRLVLLGLMGSGKSSVAAALAARLGVGVVDNDSMLEARTGLSARAIEERHGTDHLHRLELDVIGDALRSGSSDVITAAASVAEAIDVDTVLAPATVIWLRADVDTLLRRLDGDLGAADTHRPERGDPRVLLTTQIERRHPRYAALADLVVDTDDRSPDELADHICTALRLTPPSPGGDGSRSATGTD